jgi:activating signal cointegrator complex subunit 2
LIALARTYDEGLGTVARDYGGLQQITQALETQNHDDWHRIWVETKVAMIDSFDAVFRVILQDIAAASPGPALAAECERSFDIMFTLLDLLGSAAASSLPSTPFLNMSLIADYQHSYDLSKLLATALQQADDPRLDLLDSTLRSMDNSSDKSLGPLKLLLQSSGIAGVPPPQAPALARSIAPQFQDPVPPRINITPSAGPSHQGADDVDLKVTQVLDILPDQPPSYIRALLQHPDYPDAEAVIGALLEGRAPSESELDVTSTGTPSFTAQAITAPVERRNIFDDEIMDMDRIRVGKKRSV